jgi:uncharacterized protein YigA (DUF484 family)
MANRRDAAPEQDPEAGAKTGAEAAPRHALGEGEVAAYLRRHPDFLQRHPDLLDAMTPPARASGDGVVDFQQAMIQRLREELATALADRDELLAVGRANAQAQTRLHQGILALLTARSFEHLIEMLTADLAFALDIDAVSLCVEPSGLEVTPPQRPAGVYRLEAGAVDALVGQGRAVRLIDDTPGDPALFPTCAKLIRSAALIRLSIGPATPPAVIALGSRDPEHFAEGQGTELLVFLGHTVESLVRAWLDLPE